MSGAASIQRRVLALVGAGVFIAAGVLSLLSRASLLALEQQVRADQQRLTTTLARTLSGIVDDDMRLLAAVATGPRIDVADGDHTPERLAVEGAVLHSRLWSALAFVDATGASLVAAPAAERSLVDTFEIRSLAGRELASGRPAVTDRIATAAGTCVAGIVPLRAPDGRLVGAMIGLARLPNRRFDSTLHHAVPEGVLVELRDGRQAPMGGTPRAATGAAVWNATVAGTGWTLLSSTDGPDPLAPIAVFRRQSLWLAPALAAVAMLLGWGVVRSVRQPLGTLTASAERIAHGDLEHVIGAVESQSGGGEIARLAAALERMRASLKRSIDGIEEANRTLEARVAERTAELQALNLRLEDRERARQALLRKVISAQEDERRRVARELHDETSQALAALGMGVDTTLATSADEQTRGRLAELRRLVDRMHAGLNRLIVNLRPSVLDDLGLAAAIASLASRQFDPSPTSVRCELDDLEDLRLPSEMETAIFRAVQEAITNIARHANAETVLIQGTLAAGAIHLDIEDDGEGFEVDAVREASAGSMRGIGLLGMRERIEILGGSLRVESEPGRGTRVVMEVPLPEGAETRPAPALVPGGETCRRPES